MRPDPSQHCEKRVSCGVSDTAEILYGGELSGIDLQDGRSQCAQVNQPGDQDQQKRGDYGGGFFHLINNALQIAGMQSSEPPCWRVLTDNNSERDSRLHRLEKALDIEDWSFTNKIEELERNLIIYLVIEPRKLRIY